VDDEFEVTIDCTESKRWLDLWASSKPSRIVIKAMDGTVTVQPLARWPARTDVGHTHKHQHGSKDLAM
jgi:hypothetical protein